MGQTRPTFQPLMSVSDMFMRRSIEQTTFKSLVSVNDTFCAPNPPSVMHSRIETMTLWSLIN